MTDRTGPCSHRVYIQEGEEKMNQEMKEESRCFQVWYKDHQHVYKDHTHGYGMEIAGPGRMGQVLQSGGLTGGSDSRVDSSEVRNCQPCKHLGEECFEHKTHQTEQAFHSLQGLGSESATFNRKRMSGSWAELTFSQSSERCSWVTELLQGVGRL